jgi:hypothetical protein
MLCDICFWHNKYPNKECPFHICIIPTMIREEKEQQHTSIYDFWANGNFI